MTIDREKVNDLMARMLTCSTAITTKTTDDGLLMEADGYEYELRLLRDACSLLIEAAAILEKLNPPPEPMEIIKSLPPTPEAWEIQTFGAVSEWVDPGVPAVRTHPVRKNTCPKCDSRTQKIVHRVDNWLELECPVCGARWKYTNKGEAKWY
jgi:hypothetical protein